jgi:hypothetical protein
MIKSRRIRWAGHVARMGRRGIYTGYWWETQKERDHLGDLDVGGKIILSRVGVTIDRVWIGLDLTPNSDNSGLQATQRYR